MTEILREMIPPILVGEPLPDIDEQHVRLIAESALAALSAGPGDAWRAEPIGILDDAAMAARGHPATELLIWIAVHRAGLVHGDVFRLDLDAAEFLGRFPFAVVMKEHPQLVAEARTIASARYGISI